MRFCLPSEEGDYEIINFKVVVDKFESTQTLKKETIKIFNEVIPYVLALEQLIKSGAMFEEGTKKGEETKNSGILNFYYFLLDRWKFSPSIKINKKDSKIAIEQGNLLLKEGD